MNLILNLSPEIEAKLLERARATGQAPEELALHALEEKLTLTPTAPPRLTAAEWEADIRAWADSHRPLLQEADDTRESIYAGRGE